MTEHAKAADEKPLLAGRASREAVKETDPQDDAPQFPVGRLTGPDAVALLGYESHVVAGALASVNRSRITLEEAKAAVEAWLRSPITTDPGLEA